jgi:hypothetical protein
MHDASIRSAAWPGLLSARRIGAGMVLAAAAAVTTGMPAQAAIPAISFKTPVTTVHGALPLFRLQRSAPPTPFVSTALGTAIRPGVEKTRLVGRDQHGVMRGYVDAATGDAEIFPDLTAASGPATATDEAPSVAGAIFARTDIIPKDATRTRLGAATPVFSSQAQRSADGRTHPLGTPSQLFTYVSAQRYAAGLPVVGSGSQATVAVGNDGSLRGFVRRWATAFAAGVIRPTTTSDQLAKAIVTQLRGLQNANTAITVDSVAPAYYDGNAKYLQPVYLFYATLRPVSGRGTSDHIRGYVPIGTLVEPIPVIGQNTGRAPSAPVGADPAAQLRTQGAVANQISLGEYANRDGTMQDQANAYLNGFDALPAWWYGPPIVRAQWYWAYPFEVESSANSYLNAMQVAYTMPHGDWWENTTYSNYADFWYVYDIGVSGNPGYGAAAGGNLATWIIDSCEVIPSFYDLQFTWWPVFQGLHRALGFRTEMLLGEDTMNYDIALDMEEGANANSAFFNTVAAFSFPTYEDYHLNNTTVHYDRASLMYDPRNANESIYSVQGQSASGQLQNVWMGN